jgi:hypothetical protein
VLEESEVAHAAEEIDGSAESGAEPISTAKPERSGASRRVRSV